MTHRPPALSRGSEDHEESTSDGSGRGIMAPLSAGTNWNDPAVCLTVTVLGCSGDLAKKKTYPALFALFAHHHLPPRTTILGYARSTMDNLSLRAQLRGYLKGPADVVSAFLEICFYQAGQYSSGDDDKGEAVFGKLAERIAGFEAQHCGSVGNAVGHRIFYLALPPSVYPPVCANIKEACMSPSPLGWTRVVVEKPFGRDLQSSEELSSGIAKLFTEAQLYRIDHYLGKELTQNLVVMRFANRFLAPLWNRDNIANVQIIFKEPFGTEGRGRGTTPCTHACLSRRLAFPFKARVPTLAAQRRLMCSVVQCTVPLPLT